MTKLATTLWLILIVLTKLDQEQGLVETTEAVGLSVSGLSFSNHSINATTNSLPTATTTAQQIQKVQDTSFRSEVYKMHANGLMLLHAQRTRSGIGAKKSELTIDNKSTNSGINYHVRSKKPNETATQQVEPGENEKLEAKLLGELPQVRQKRSRDQSPEKNPSGEVYIYTNEPTSRVDIKKQYTSRDVSPCSNTATNLTNSIVCRHRAHHHHHHHHHHHNKHKHQWRSIVQGEDIYGEEVKKTKVYPEKLTDKRKVRTNATTQVVRKKNNLVNNAPLLTAIQETKHHRLRRALNLMMGDMVDDNPLYDSQQPEAPEIDESPQKDLEDIPELGSLHNRGLAQAVPSISPISPIRKSMEEYDQSDMNDEPTYLASRRLRSNIFDDGHQSNAFEDIPDIPSINQLVTGADITDVRRLKPLGEGEGGDDIEEEEGEKREQLYRNDLEDEEIEKLSTIKELSTPTAIPFLLTVSNIPMISDIPTLRAIPPPAVKTGNEVGKGTPHVQSVDTKEGKETHVSV